MGREASRGPSSAGRRAAALGVLLAVAGGFWPSDSPAAEALIDGIAAQVGGEIVLVSEVDQMADPIEQRMRAAGAPAAEIGGMRADVLDRLVESRLLSSAVRRLELDASDVEVDRAIESIAADAGITIEQLEQSVVGHGLTLTAYRDKIRSEIERSKVFNTMVRARVKVEPTEVEALYWSEFADQPDGGEEVHLRHILVAASLQLNRDGDTACRMALEARTAVAAGQADFRTMAARLSDVNRERGGDMGWVHARELASWMAPEVAKLQPGDMSDVFQTRFGCNLIQLVDRREFERVTIETARPALERRVMRQKMEEEYVKWIEELRENTYIERKEVVSTSGGLDGSRGLR